MRLAASWRRRFRDSLIVRIGAAILLVQSAVLSILGYYYVSRFHAEIDREVDARILAPANLIGAGLLNIDSMTQKSTVESLLGRDLVRLEHSLIVGANGNVFQALQPENVGREFTALSLPVPLGFDPSSGGPHLERFERDGVDLVVAMSPLYAVGGRSPFLFSYVMVSTAEAEARKAGIALLFVAGLGAATLLTTAAIVLSFRLRFSRRIRSVLGVLERLRKGELDARVSGSLARDEIGDLQRLVNSTADELEKSLTSLAASEEKYRLLFSKERDAVFLFESETGRLLDANEGAVATYGYAHDELLDLTIFALAASNDNRRDGFAARIPADDEATSFQWHRRKDGTVFPVEVSAGSFEWKEKQVVCCIARDITDRKRTEEELVSRERELRQAQKMEAVGLLAGGVAHDFNNILTIIQGYAGLLLDTRDSDIHPKVEAIHQAATRAAALTRQLLAFSRRQVMQPKILDLNDLVASTENLLARVIGEDIELSVDPAPDLGAVKADPSQLEQVVMNLVVNARDAMPDGGRISIRTKNTVLGKKSARRLEGAGPGEYVLLSVADTGAGMDEKTLTRIFEPFYTTKGPGRGTGLGLSTVYGIVKQSGGYVYAFSEPSRGSTFHVYLPRVSGAAQRPKREAERETQGAESILVVEDDAAVLSLAREVLTSRGYEVLEGRSGMEALSILKRRGGEVDLVISDLVMPGMSGRELATRIARLYPGIRILLMSGYTDDVVLQRGLASIDGDFIQKPFSLDALARKVRALLDRRPGRRAADASSSSS